MVTPSCSNTTLIGHWDSNDVQKRERVKQKFVYWTPSPLKCIHFFAKHEYNYRFGFKVNFLANSIALDVLILHFFLPSKGANSAWLPAKSFTWGH